MIPGGVIAYPRPRPVAVMHPQPQPTHIDRYRILDSLDDGVFSAKDPEGRTVVVKIGNSEDYAYMMWRKRNLAVGGGLAVGDYSEWENRRVENEINCLRRLSHPSIVTLLDHGIENGRRFLVMEYVDGKSIASVEGMRSAEAICVLRQTASALDHMHQVGIVHRDVKPQNILIDVNGIVKLLDFERATEIGEPPWHGCRMGTVEFYSPEQVHESINRGWHVDGRSDQYGLAVVAYGFLVGRMPFEARHPLPLPDPTELDAWASLFDLAAKQVFFQVLYVAPPSPGALNPSLSTGVGVVLLRGLAKDPADRYRSCGEFVEALGEAL